MEENTIEIDGLLDSLFEATVDIISQALPAFLGTLESMVAGLGDSVIQYPEVWFVVAVLGALAYITKITS